MEKKENITFVDYNGKTFLVNDKVLYVPNHAFGDRDHKDCEIGVITSIRDGNVWVRYEKQHITQPGQRTPLANLHLI